MLSNAITQVDLIKLRDATDYPDNNRYLLAE